MNQRSDRPQLLVCSGWQTHNIGDVAHTPGLLALLEEFVPEADVTVWPFRPLTPAIVAMIGRRFPRISFVEGELAPDGSTGDPALAAALDSADFLLHSSGPATLAWERLDAFARRTGRRFGVYGVTYGLYGKRERETLSRAAFVYFRDSPSLAAAKRDSIHSPLMEWSPDAAFAFDIRDDATAKAYLAASGLEPGRFLCCIGRLRNTPFWLMPGVMSPFDADKHARNEAMREHDHRPLRDAIEAVVRQTDMKVLICPEDHTQLQISRDNLFDLLSPEARSKVVWRDRFWLPDEAMGVYVRSAGLFGAEMHSPIMCVGNGVPAIVCRWAEQSTKGLMWRDIGLSDWLFDLDEESELTRVAPAALELADRPSEAAVKANQARSRVRERFATTMTVVRDHVMAARNRRSLQKPVDSSTGSIRLLV